MRLQALSVIATRIAQFQMVLETVFVAITTRQSALNLRAHFSLVPVHYPVRLNGDEEKRWCAHPDLRRSELPSDLSLLLRGSSVRRNTSVPGIDPAYGRFLMPEVSAGDR